MIDGDDDVAERAGLGARVGVGCVGGEGEDIRGLVLLVPA